MASYVAQAIWGPAKGVGTAIKADLGLLCGLRVVDESMLEVFDNGSILHVMRRDCATLMKLRRSLCLTSILALLLQRRLRWFGHDARRPEGELIKDFLMPTWPRTWYRRTGGQLKA